MITIKRIQKILLVDDEPEFLRSLQRFLKREPFHLALATQGDEAKALLSEAAQSGDPFDLVITDLLMPKVDGWQLIDWIQEFHPNILAMILTGVGENGISRVVLRPGMDLYLRKDITPQQLLKKIRQLEESNQSIERNQHE